ncbi:uncharacterized protein [Dermacentor andersoni]|uniref:uncharacterized protein n=1 Tax=Dermacentor andersoni TaxID=34620 RepID=UPI003B3BC364
MAWRPLLLLLLLLLCPVQGRLALSDFVSSVTLSPTFKAKIATAGPVTATYGVSFPLELEIAGEGGEDGREALLRAAQMALEHTGVDGAACVRRAQCEAAGGRLARHGLVGEVLDLFLRGPRCGRQERSGLNCSQEFRSCPYSLFTAAGTE